MQDWTMQDNAEKRRTFSKLDTVSRHEGHHCRTRNASTMQSNSVEVGCYSVMGTRCHNIKQQ